MTDSDTSTDQAMSHKFEIVLAILLGLSAVLVAWTTYQSGLLNGASIKEMNRSIRVSDEASQQWNEGNQDYQSQVTLFLDYAKADLDGDTDTAEFILEELMEDDFYAAVQWSEDPANEADSPFVDENPEWVVAGWVEAEKLDAEADELFKSGEDFNTRSDRQALWSVLLATALFMFGLAAIMRGRTIRIVLTVAGVAFLAVAIVGVISSGYYGG